MHARSQTIQISSFCFPSDKKAINSYKFPQTPTEHQVPRPESNNIQKQHKPQKTNEKSISKLFQAQTGVQIGSSKLVPSWFLPFLWFRLFLPTSQGLLCSHAHALFQARFKDVRVGSRWLSTLYILSSNFHSFG